jgi:hypothetical protein
MEAPAPHLMVGRLVKIQVAVAVAADNEITNLTLQ